MFFYALISKCRVEVFVNTFDCGEYFHARRICILQVGGYNEIQYVVRSEESVFQCLSRNLFVNVDWCTITLILFNGIYVFAILAPKTWKTSDTKGFLYDVYTL